MKRYRSLLASVLVIGLGMTMGCVSSQPKKLSTSGFLGTYPTFEKGADHVDLRYLKKGVDFKKYNKIMMDEVVFYFNTASSNYKGIHASEIQELSEVFHKTFIETFGTMLTDKPGPNVIRMRLAVTDIEPSNPASGTISTVIPVGLAVSLIKKGTTGEYIGIGSATAEVEFLDSITNERVAAAIDKAPGGKLDVGKTSPAKSAFKYWSKRLYAFMTSE